MKTRSAFLQLQAIFHLVDHVPRKIRIDNLKAAVIDQGRVVAIRRLLQVQAGIHEKTGCFLQPVLHLLFGFSPLSYRFIAGVMKKLMDCIVTQTVDGNAFF